MPAAPADTPPALWFDLTDLAVWRGPLTGIQRAMAGLARAFLDAGALPAAPAGTAPGDGRGRPIRFCYYKRYAGFIELPDEATQALLAGLGSDEAMIPAAKGGWLMRKVRRRITAKTCAFRPGDGYFNASIVMQPTTLRDLDATLAALAMPMVVAVYDVVPLLFREWCKDRTHDMFSRWFDVVLRRSALILTPSENTRRDVIACADRAGLPCPEVLAVPLPHSFGAPAAATPAAPGGVDDAARLPDRFALYVSTIEPRKNHRLLFYLWKRLIARHGAERVPDLVFIGKRGWQSNDFVAEMTNSAFLDGKIRWIAGADDALLADAYRRCRFTLFPSFYEGFGLPVAESLCFGRPCFASSQGSIPEVGGDFVDYFDPYELSEAEALVERAMFDEAFLAARAQRIREQFVPSTWPAYAARVLAETGRAFAAPPG